MKVEQSSTWPAVCSRRGRGQCYFKLHVVREKSAYLQNNMNDVMNDVTSFFAFLEIITNLRMTSYHDSVVLPHRSLRESLQRFESFFFLKCCLINSNYKHNKVKDSFGGLVFYFYPAFLHVPLGQRQLTPSLTLIGLVCIWIDPSSPKLNRCCNEKEMFVVAGMLCEIDHFEAWFLWKESFILLHVDCTLNV